MKQIVRFALQDEQTVLAEIDAPDDDGRVGLHPTEIIEDAKLTFDQALENVKPMATKIIEKLRTLNHPADEVEVKFGIKLTAEAGAIIATAGGEVNYEITLKWSNNKAGD
mgnify:CR=1 FL=1